MNRLDSIEMEELRIATPDGVSAITSVSLSKGFAFMSVRPNEETPQDWNVARLTLLERLAKRDISVEMLQFAPSRVRFIVEEGVAARVGATADEIGLAWRLVPHCCKISIVGAGIRTTAGVFYRAFTALTRRNVPVLHSSDSNVTMSLIVPKARGQEAQAVLHDALFAEGGLSLSATITFDALLGRVRIDGKEYPLGSRQAKLLGYLIENVGRVVRSEEAARHLFGLAGKEELAALRVHMHNLRKKIEEDPDNPRYLVTVPAQGYLFVR